MTTAKVRLVIGDEREDGSCDVKVYDGDDMIDEFVSSQAELKVFALETAGFAVPGNMRAAAEEAARKRQKDKPP